ncbi:MAG TPA: phage holin [Methanosarcinales archaeon]|nr:phage holin [Methanosarcinales archaeon]
MLNRMRNKVFITTLIAAIVMMAKQFNLFEVPANWETLVNTILSLFIMLGIVIDPTTPGVKDGE